MELVIIIGIIVLVLLTGVLLARKGFVRGTMPSKPEEDEPGPSAVAAPGAHEARRRAPE